MSDYAENQSVEEAVTGVSVGTTTRSEEVTELDAHRQGPKYPFGTKEAIQGRWS